MPKLTVITACLNAGATIERTVVSVFEQRVPDLEYLVVDGGSRDDTVRILEKYGKGITWWISERDEGLADAWNKGVARATGEWIGFLNAGDWYHSGALRRIVEITERTTADILHGHMQVWDSQGHRRRLVKLGPKDAKAAVLRGWMINHPTCFIRRELFGTVGHFDRRYTVATDYDWILRACVAGARFELVDEVVTHFCVGGLSDRKFLVGIWEQRVSMRAHGVGGLREDLELAWVATKAALRRTLERAGLERVVDSIRTRTGRWGSAQ